MEIVLAIILIILLIAAFMGNVVMITALFVQDSFPITDTENAFLVTVAVVADIVLLCLLIKKLSKPAAKSLLLAKQGITTRINIKKQSGTVKKASRNIANLIYRLKELRAIGIDQSSTTRTYNFCHLLAALSNEDEINVCLEAVNQKKAVVTEIGDIEQNILQLANRYKEVGNIEKCIEYLQMLEHGENKYNFDEIRNTCNEQMASRESERKAMKLWASVIVSCLLVIALLSGISYCKGAPYREMHSMIAEQSLTREMLNYNNRRNEKSYYESLHTEKGYKFLASELTKLHKENDIEKAMWLLCVQPNCIDGMDLCASQDFVNWITDYAKSKGNRSTNQDGEDDYWYSVNYTVNEYEITISSFDDKNSDISDFSIRHEGNSAKVSRRNPYHDGTVPTIE